jgi:hypothetical protein
VKALAERVTTFLDQCLGTHRSFNRPSQASISTPFAGASNYSDQSRRNVTGSFTPTSSGPWNLSSRKPVAHRKSLEIRRTLKTWP